MIGDCTRCHRSNYVVSDDTNANASCASVGYSTSVHITTFIEDVTNAISITYRSHGTSVCMVYARVVDVTRNTFIRTSTAECTCECPANVVETTISIHIYYKAKQYYG